MRSAAIDFSTKSKEPGTKKDEVLEENLIDVRRILKNATFNKSYQDKEIVGPSSNIKDSPNPL